VSGESGEWIPLGWTSGGIPFGNPAKRAADVEAEPQLLQAEPGSLDGVVILSASRVGSTFVVSSLYRAILLTLSAGRLLFLALLAEGGK
jgi:hypothetical protein